MERINACDYKKLFDTQFEADRAAALASYKFGTEMVAYQCYKHYHIANANPALRNHHVKKPRVNWCEICKVVLNPKNYDKHILKARHLQLAVRPAEVHDEGGDDTK